MVVPLAAELAACAGILLGTPVLKLRGDYLAIVAGLRRDHRVLMNNLEHPVNITNGPRNRPDVDVRLNFGSRW